MPHVISEKYGCIDRCAAEGRADGFLWSIVLRAERSSYKMESHFFSKKRQAVIPSYLVTALDLRDVQRTICSMRKLATNEDLVHQLAECVHILCGRRVSCLFRLFRWVFLVPPVNNTALWSHSS